MTASMPWVKLYTEILDDPKLSELSASSKWHFVELILLAGECDAEGFIVNGTQAMSIKQMAWRLRLDEDNLAEYIEELTLAGLLSEDVDTGALLVVNFSKRQGRSQAEKREQWRAAQEKRRTPEPVIDESNMTHTPREEKRREEVDISEQKTPRKTKQSDPRSKHPAILMAKGVSGNKYPPIELYDDIIRVVGDKPDGVKAAECRHEWVKRGYNGQSWNWLIEWYATGIPGRNNNNGTQPKRTAINAQGKEVTI